MKFELQNQLVKPIWIEHIVKNNKKLEEVIDNIN